MMLPHHGAPRSLPETPKRRHKGSLLTAVGISPRGSSVASANGDGTVRLWSVMEGDSDRAPLIERVYGFHSIAFNPDGSGLVVGGKDGIIYGWALPSGEALFEPVRGAHTSKVLQLAFNSHRNFPRNGEHRWHVHGSRVSVRTDCR